MHDEHSRSRGELWLARQLQQAARREQPQFSESLHQRIMQAIRPTLVDSIALDSKAAEPICADPAPAAEKRNGAPRRRADWLTAAWLTSAAAILAMVIAARWFANSDARNGFQQPQSAVAPPSAKPVAAQPSPGANAVPNKLVETGTSQPVKSLPTEVEPDDIASAAANYTLDDLSRDAQATAHLLVDQLPFETPTEEWGL